MFGHALPLSKFDFQPLFLTSSENLLASTELLVQAIDENIDLVIEQYTEVISMGFEQVKTQIPQLVGSILEAISSRLPETKTPEHREALVQAALKLVEKFAEDNSGETVKKMVTQILSNVKGIWSSLDQSGKQMVALVYLASAKGNDE